MQLTLPVQLGGVLAVCMDEFFDDDFPPGEQIPRQLNVTLRSAPDPLGEVVKMTVNGLPVGNPLTDNARSEMGYRWHDALHLAHAVCLGWSPVLRSLAGIRGDSPRRSGSAQPGIRRAAYGFGRTAVRSGGRPHFGGNR